jgi:hypothetical protein
MVRHDVDGAKDQLADQQKLKGERITYALYGLAWLMTDPDDKFIKFPADIKKDSLMREVHRGIPGYGASFKHQIRQCSPDTCRWEALPRERHINRIA